MIPQICKELRVLRFFVNGRGNYGGLGTIEDGLARGLGG